MVLVGRQFIAWIAEFQLVNVARTVMRKRFSHFVSDFHHRSVCGSQINGNAGVTSVVGWRHSPTWSVLRWITSERTMWLITLMFGADGCRLLASVIVENGSVLADWRLFSVQSIYCSQLWQGADLLPLEDEEPTAAETKFAQDVVKLASIVKLERNNVSLSALTNLC